MLYFVMQEEEKIESKATYRKKAIPTGMATQWGGRKQQEQETAMMLDVQ